MNGQTRVQPALEATDIRKSFGNIEVLKGVDLAVAKREVVSIIGSSGSGKSTFLRCLNLLETPQQGRVDVEGESFSFGEGSGQPSAKDLIRLRRKVGMVFQNFNLFPHKTAIENVIEGPVHALGTSAADARELGMQLLGKVGLEDRASHYPQQLSGGQKQRVAIARALAMKPQVMLFDEVTSALDPELVGEVLTVLEDLAADGMTMILVTHEIAFAAEISSRVGFMTEGKLSEIGPPKDMILNPQSDRLARFLERFNRGHRL